LHSLFKSSSQISEHFCSTGKTLTSVVSHELIICYDVPSYQNSIVSPFRHAIRDGEDCSIAYRTRTEMLGRGLMMLQAVLAARPDSQPPMSCRSEVVVTFRSIRPSLLDLRFSGDAWVVQRRDGSMTLCLGNSPLARISALPFDQVSLNNMVHQTRHRRPRWRLNRRSARPARAMA
jgi:hypothetical protein